MTNNIPTTTNGRSRLAKLISLQWLTVMAVFAIVTTFVLKEYVGGEVAIEAIERIAYAFIGFRVGQKVKESSNV